LQSLFRRHKLSSAIFRTVTIKNVQNMIKYRLKSKKYKKDGGKWKKYSKKKKKIVKIRNMFCKKLKRIEDTLRNKRWNRRNKMNN